MLAIPRQVMKGFATDRSTADDVDNEALTPEDWCTSAEAFLRSEANSDSKDLAAARKKKLFRIKAFEVCCCLENWVWLMRGHGLSHYADDLWHRLEKGIRQPAWGEGDPKVANDNDWLWVVSDKASANLTPLCDWSYDKHLRLGWYGDINHDLWNEVKLASAEANFSELFKLIMVVANCTYGPFDNGGFWAKTLDAAADYKRKATSSCPLLGHFMPMISKEPPPLGSQRFAMRLPSVVRVISSQRGCLAL